MLTRVSCWQCQLRDFMEHAKHRQFQYGTWDCCLFAADAIQWMTGTDIAARFRGKYSTAKQARKFGSVRKIVEMVTAKHFMFECPSITYAQRGDLVLIKRARDYSLGIVDLDGMNVAVLHKDGLIRIPLKDAQRAWRV